MHMDANEIVFDKKSLKENPKNFPGKIKDKTFRNQVGG